MTRSDTIARPAPPRSYRWLVLLCISAAMFANYYVFDALNPVGPQVTGEAIYTDDLKFDGMLYAKVRRAMIPHGLLKKLDVSKARALPGVVSILTAQDIPGEKTHGLVIYDWPVMIGIGERVRYVGDALAIVAAQSQEIAEQAAGMIEAEFDLQPVLTNPFMARQNDVPQIHEKGNLLKHIKIRKGDIDAGFALAESPLNTHFTLKPQTTLSSNRSAALPCRSRTGAWKFMSARRSRIKTALKLRVRLGGRRNAFALWDS